MNILRLDHLVLTVEDLDATVRFYEDVLDMEARAFDAGRTALHFGDQKINLHVVGKLLEPRAAQATVGSADLCFITDTPVAEVLKRLADEGVAVEKGPTAQTGALGPMTSVYFRDPSGNLIEVANYDETPPREPQP